MKIFLESSQVHTTQIRNKCNCWESSGQCKGKQICCIVAIKSEWNWWEDFMEFDTYLRKVTDLKPGRRPMQNVLGNQFKNQFYPFGSLFEYLPIPPKDQSRIHQFGKKVLPWLFHGYSLYAEGEIWKGDVLVADIEELETMDASEIYSNNAKEIIFPKKKEKLFFQSQMDESKSLEEIRNWKHPPWYGIDPFKERVYWLSWRIRMVFSNTSRLFSRCRWSDEWFLVNVRNYTYTHPIEPRV